MKHSFLQSRHQQKYLRVPLAGLMLMASLANGNASAVLANPSEVTVTPGEHQFVEAKSVSPSEEYTASTRGTGSFKQLADGVYLYGKSSQPEQIGQEYMVFEVRDGQAIGAFYMPSSEFSCFRGTLQAQQLKVSLASPDAEIAQETPDEGQEFQPVAVGSTSPSNRFDAVTFPLTVKLQDYHQITSVSENDQRILSMCKANYQ
ncbi:hypothetical protein H6S82_30920 [Planktothrix sp. FACHB-1355]|uniref:Uncharacterized protein n=1 Tax=Aerosakkonema funiforme FACHB-1375 TaxID=2949571 RepID=A0A926VLT3_9CYAN|nr:MULTISPECIES: hypothetical protein [Oscillatoriales]MBD2186287.1 hypothetical protein [Aerosakkonema funiforme FACHB-1375]MBD3563218.1 hypothetical protein [Planktothrix sp. FACHB-1355]